MPVPRGQATLSVNSSGLSDVGRKREQNEDSILLRPDLGLFLVADGMGGHSAGEVASQLAVGAMVRGIEQSGEVSKVPDEILGAARLKNAILSANEEVFRASAQNKAHRGMGSTVVALYIGAGIVHIGHVGDSRCYRIRSKRIDAMTTDHSFINDILAAKPDTPMDQLAHVPKNIITRALGMHEVVAPTIRTEKAVDGDIYLLCSDGLSGLVQPGLMLELVGDGADLGRSCGRLVEAANAGGGTDNISVVLVRIDPAPARRLRHCPGCGRGNDEGNKFCIECGRKLA